MMDTLINADYKILRKYLQNYKTSHIIIDQKDSIVELIKKLLAQKIIDQYIYMNKYQAKQLWYCTNLAGYIIKLDNRCVLQYEDPKGVHEAIFDDQNSMNNFINDHKCCDHDCACFRIIKEVYQSDFIN